MKRRAFSLLAGGSTLALAALQKPAFAQTAGPAQLLKTTLTPMGAERAGNAAGTIPAWAGGFTTVPAGWNPTEDMEPDFFADDKLLYTVGSSNMSQYADLLTDGVQHMIQTYGYSLQVYPTHRTASAPQWVYDNIVANAGRAQLNPDGGRLGFTGGYGGIPFPIIDISDPDAAGAKVMWNHICKWQGTAFKRYSSEWVIQGGELVLSGAFTEEALYPYYNPNGSLATYNGYISRSHDRYFGPATQQGSEVVVWVSTDPLVQPQIAWQLLQGQGRVRKAPEISYDTPASQVDDVCNYDEFDGFYGALDRYDWKFIAKKEMLIPYNNNKLRRTPAQVALGPKFVNPDAMRWELHRVWVVEANVHPGKRNVLVRRQFHVDEDTWLVALADGWDGSGSLYKSDMICNLVHPQLPGTVEGNNFAYDFQTGDYTASQGAWGEPPFNRPQVYYNSVPDGDVEPQAMAAAASY